MTKLEFELDEVTLKNVENRLGEMKSKAPDVLKKAVNKTAKDARKDLAEKAQETYTIKTGGFNRQMRIQNATVASMTATIRATGASTKMKEFKTYGGKGGAQLSVLINRMNGRKTFGAGSRYFVNKISKKGQSGSGHVGVAKFYGGGEPPSRLHIKERYSISIPGMIGNERDVYGVVKPDIENNLKKNVELYASKVLGSSGGSGGSE